MRVALDEALQASTGYLAEHNSNIRIDALKMAGDVTQNGAIFYLDPHDLSQFLSEQMYLRGLTEAVIFDPSNNQILASNSVLGLGVALPPPAAVLLARSGDVAIQDSSDGRSVTAVVDLSLSDARYKTMLAITRAGRSGDPWSTCARPSGWSPSTTGSITTAPGCRSPS